MITKGYKLVDRGNDGVLRSIARDELPAEWVQAYTPGKIYTNKDAPFFALDTLENAKEEARCWGAGQIEIWECSGEFIKPNTIPGGSQIPYPFLGARVLKRFWNAIAAEKIPFLECGESRCITDGTLYAKKIKLERRIDD